MSRMLERLKRLMPTKEALQGSRWLRWLGPGLFHPRLWHMSRRGIALGVGIGAFFAFLIPVAQIPLSAATAVALRANIPSAVAATLVNNPVTFPAVYYAAWRVGSALMGRQAKAADAPVIPAAAEVAANPDPGNLWERSRQAVASVGAPLLLGAFVFACVGAVLGYTLVNGAWHLRVRLKRRARQRRRLIP